MLCSVHEADSPACRVLLACALVVSGTVSCSAPRVDKPAAPDMTALVESYQRPTASFDPERLPQLVGALTVVDQLLDRTNLRTELVNVLREVLGAAVDASTQVDDELEIDVEADGYMRITRICSGWSVPPAPVRDQNGALLVTGTFSQRGLDPILWGEADRCRYLTGDLQVELLQDASSTDAVRVYWGEAIEAANLDERALLVDMGLTALLDGEALPLDFDFRSLADGSIEHRIDLGDGSLIASTGRADRVHVRASNGTFDCDELDCSQTAAAGEP